METGWVIERGSAPLYYLTLKGGQVGWSKHHMDALRFARQDDAKAFSDTFIGPTTAVRLADHAWYTP